MVREVGGHSGCASGDVRSGTPLLKAMETAAAADPDAVKLWGEHSIVLPAIQHDHRDALVLADCYFSAKPAAANDRTIDLR